MAMLEKVVVDEEEEHPADMERDIAAVASAFPPPSQTSRLARRRSSVTKPPTTSKPPKERRKKDIARKIAAAEASSSITTHIPQSMLTSRSLPLLVCSVGNPGSQYANTLHSAGHTVLNRLAERLGYPQFHQEKTYGNGLLSRPSYAGDGGDWTLWQSTSYMNECGKGVRAAYMAWARNIPDGEGRLIVIHDELEKPLGVVTVRTKQGGSARGHNGLKSIMGVIGDTPFVRVGVGIDRPISRASDDVARYVLKKMDPAQKAAIEGSVEQVVAKLKQLENGKG